MAIILIGIFLFPVVFQSFHIVQHQSHEHEYCSAQHHIADYKITKGLFFKQLSEKEEHCIVCEYQFSLHDFPAVAVYRTATLLTESILIQLFENLPATKAFSQAEPRAPPRINLV